MYDRARTAAEIRQTRFALHATTYRLSELATRRQQQPKRKKKKQNHTRETSPITQASICQNGVQRFDLCKITFPVLV